MPTNLPPEYFADFVTPYVKRMSELIHQYGAKMRLHCHGNIARVLDEIMKTEPDALDPIEPPPDGDIELGEVKKRIGDKVCLFGNIEMSLLEQGEAGETYNICSGTTHSLDSVLALLSEITGHSVIARVNPDFVRPNELQRLCGDPAKLEARIGALSHPPLSQTLEWMLQDAEV